MIVLRTNSLYNSEIANNRVGNLSRLSREMCLIMGVGLIKIDLFVTKPLL